ncbi:hypothetical protein IFR05_011638 [Cadophora sp. M221]|nr:hypothetical protein IFR05_011638 [Cadophora sp. M221]
MQPSNATENASSSDVKHYQPSAFSTGLPPKKSTNVTGVYTATFDASKHNSATRQPHQPYTKPAGPHFVNSTASEPTGTVSIVYSGTVISAEFGNPTATGTIYVASVNSVKPVHTSTGRLPIPVTKGSSPHFLNGTTAVTSQHGTSISHTGSSGLSTPTMPGHVRPTGASSGFAKPTAANQHAVPLHNSSATTSKSARRPLTKSNGFHFPNSTSGITNTIITRVSGFVKPTISRTVSGFPTTSGHPSYSKPSRPQSNSTSTRTLPTVGMISTGGYSIRVQSTVLSTATVIPTLSRHLPYTKSTGLVFLNSTSTVSPTNTNILSNKPIATAPLSTGLFSTGVLPLSLSTGISSTGTAAPYSKPTSALFINSTSEFTPKVSLSTGVFATGTSVSITHTESVPSVVTFSAVTFSAVTFSASNTQPVKILALSSMSLHSTISSSAYPSTGAITSTLASTPTTMITKASPKILVSSTGFAVSKSSTASTAASPSHVVIPQYYQCGGINFKGEGSCAKGSICKKWNPYYHQCVDERYA